MSNIICISLQGLGIPDHIRDHLLLTSSDMYKKRLDFSKFEWGNYEGRITTSFHQVGFGIFSGVWFFAEIEWGLDGHSQKTIMNYMVHPRDLSTAWADFLL